MASQSPSGSPTSTDSAPSETSSHSGNDNPGFKPGSSLPFSFLVTFIAIFLFFLGCGIGSRRVTRTLRRNLGLQVTGLELDRRQSRIPRARPLLLDVFPKETPSVLGGKGVEGMFSHSWKQLAPLGATYVRTEPAADSEDAPNPELDSPSAVSPPPGSQAAMAFRWPSGHSGFVASRGVLRSIPRLPPPPTPRAPLVPSRTANTTRRAARPEMYWRGRRIPDWIARPLMPDPLDGPQSGLGYDPAVRPEHQTSDEASEDAREVEALQVVVLISMPCPERAQASRPRDSVWERSRRESGSSGKSCVEVEVFCTLSDSLSAVGQSMLFSATSRPNWMTFNHLFYGPDEGR